MKIYIANFKSRPMDITNNFAKAMEQLENCIAEKCDVIVFPAAFLFGAEAGVVKKAEWAVAAYNTKMAELMSKAAENGIAVVADKLDSYGSFVPAVKNDTALSDYRYAVVKNSSELFCNVNSICNRTHIVFINWLEKVLQGRNPYGLKHLKL